MFGKEWLQLTINAESSRPGLQAKSPVEICDQNIQQPMDTGSQRMGRNVKTLENLWWLQILKRQELTFLPNHWFGA